MLYSISDRVSEYCSRTKTTRDDLAGMLGFSRQTLRSKLNGDVEFKVTEAIELAEILGCSIDEFRPLAERAASNHK